MRVTDTKLPSFFAYADAVACAQNKNHISVFNPADSKYALRLRKLELVNLALGDIIDVGLRFEGANNSTTITDDAATPLSWSCVGGAKISTADYKFGSSSLVLDGSGDYVTTTGLTSLGSVWTAEIFVKSADIGSNVAKQVFQFINGSGYGFDVMLAKNTAGAPDSTTTRLRVYISSNGTSANVANNIYSTTSLGTDISGAWHHVRCTFDGAAYKFYWDGSLVLTIPSSLSVCAFSSVSIGGNSSVPAQTLAGYVDSFLLTSVVRNTGNFTVPTQDFLTSGNNGRLRFDLNLISALSAGTDLTPRAHDTAQPVLGNTPAGLLVKTNGTATEAYPYSALSMNNAEILLTGQQIDYQGMNLLPNDDSLQALTLRAGEGFSVKQITASTVGSFGWLLHFTSEPLV